jgi:FtsH-binding integral membrane protein
MSRISTTFIAEIVKVLSIIALLLGFDINTEELEVVIGLIVVIASSAWTLWERYKRGDVTKLFIKK